MSEQHFNGLTPEQDELLSLLAEECAEVIQAVMKIKRHGPSSYNPDDTSSERLNNLDHLNKELGHVEVAKDLLRPLGFVSEHELQMWRSLKARKIGKWLHHHQMPIDEDDDEIPF